MLEVKSRSGWAHARDRPTRCAAVRLRRAATVAAARHRPGPRGADPRPPVAATSPVPPRGRPGWWSVMRELGQARIEERPGETAGDPRDDRDEAPAVVAQEPDTEQDAEQDAAAGLFVPAQN